MASSPISQSAGRLLNLMGPMIEFFTNSDYSRRVDSGDPSICNFVTGDPQEFPLPGVIEAVTRALVPQSSSWLAYTTSDDAAKADIAARLNRRVGVPFTPGDVCFTPGAFGALFVAMKAVLDPGDEVITVIPNWPFYQWLIIGAGGEPVEVPATRPGWDLDLDAIASAVTGRTRAIIVNTPNNPTGRIYQPETLARLGEMLSEASERIGRTIYLLSTVVQQDRLRRAPVPLTVCPLRQLRADLHLRQGPLRARPQARLPGTQPCHAEQGGHAGVRNRYPDRQRVAVPQLGAAVRRRRSGRPVDRHGAA